MEQFNIFLVKMNGEIIPSCAKNWQFPVVPNTNMSIINTNFFNQNNPPLLFSLIHVDCCRILKNETQKIIYGEGTYLLNISPIV